MPTSARGAPPAASEVERQAALVRAILEVSAELDLDAVLQRIVDVAAQVTDARYAALGVIGPGDRIVEFITHGVSEKERAAIGPIPVGRGILGLLIKDPRPLRLADLSHHPQSSGFPANHPPMRSFLGAPVTARGRVFGNIYLTEKRGADEFTTEDEESLLVLATHAGIAIENARLYEDSRQRERWLTALGEITDVILEGETEADALLELIARRAVELVSADLATIVSPDVEGDELIVRVAYGLNSHDILGMVVPATGSISGEVIAKGEPITLANASDDKRSFQPMVRSGSMGPALFVPLSMRGSPFGTLAVSRLTGSVEFSPTEVSLVQSFANQVSLALEHSRMQRELNRLAVMDERERIATELHDGVIQGLFAMGLNLQATAQMVNDTVVEKRLEDVVNQLDGSIRDLRNYIFGLRPGALADRQLQQTLSDMAHEFQEASGIPIELDINLEVAAELAGRAGEVVQLARETLSNVRRHAQATRCWISLVPEGRAAVLEIRDNGVGFDASKGSPAGHHGLRNLRRRVASIGGSLDLTSSAGKGTTVRAVIPI